MPKKNIFAQFKILFKGDGKLNEKLHICTNIVFRID